VNKIRTSAIFSVLAAVALLAACGTGGSAKADTGMAAMQGESMAPEGTMAMTAAMALDPQTAPRAVIDRFSPQAGTLMVRSASNGLPGPNQPIDLDQGPFITAGLGPSAEGVRYYNFQERPLSITPGGQVPVSPIFVAFNINPDQPGGGPASGFRTEPGSQQTHNVVATLPQDAGYSPLWSVSPYDNADFGSVHDLRSALSAHILARGVATVNCPVVSEQPMQGMGGM
jgi:hypothetical protein